MSHEKEYPYILLVDDTSANLSLLRLLLNKVKAKLILALSGVEALQISRDKELALAIVDVRMPGMTGYEMAVKLNEERRQNKVPIIFLTANYIDQKEVLEGYSHGAVDYISKPFSIQILLSKVNVFLELFNQKQTIERNAKLLTKSLEELTEANNRLKEREQKQLKEQLFNKVVLESIPGIYYLFSFPELKLVGWNKQHETIFGYSADEMQGSSIWDWHLSENEQLVRNTFCNFNTKVPSKIEAPLLTKGGRLIPFLLTAVRFESDGEQYIMGVGTDVSELKLAEQALRNSEAVLTRAQQIARVGSWEYDYHTKILDCSDETFRIFGFAPNSVVPSLDLFYNMVHADDLVLLKENIAGVIASHIPLSIDLRILLPSGEERFVHEQAEMVFDANGKASKWLGTVHDITLRKKTEEELKQSLEKLQQLSKHIEQARENERLNLARELHDDLGQALTAVKIDLDIIKQQSTDEILKVKLQNVKELVGNTIRSVQQITSQLRPEIIEDLGLEAAIDWYSKDYATRYGIEVLLNVENDIPISNEKALTLFRIMQESLTNIARHAGATHIEISIQKSQDNIEFVITDNGKGISDGEIHSKKSFGIMSMNERAQILGGTFEIGRGEALGTKIRICCPHKMNDL